jgi:hypothetical protein
MIGTVKHKALRRLFEQGDGKTALPKNLIWSTIIDAKGNTYV